MVQRGRSGTAATSRQNRNASALGETAIVVGAQIFTTDVSRIGRAVTTVGQVFGTKDTNVQCDFGTASSHETSSCWSDHHCAMRCMVLCVDDCWWRVMDGSAAGCESVLFVNAIGEIRVHGDDRFSDDSVGCSIVCVMAAVHNGVD